jgi:hypothetical protein
MANYKSATASSQGSPNLEALQFIQEQLPAGVLSELTFTCKVSVTTGGDAGITADIPVGAEIIGASVVCTRASSSGTMTVKTGASSPVAITDAMACETDKAVDYAATIDDATHVVGVNGVKVFANAAADAGIVYIQYRK